MIVVAPDRDGLDDSCFEGFGASRWVVLPAVRTCGQAMAAAVRAASAPFVTYTEEHQYLDEEWAGNLVAAHARGYDVVGFAMENANPGTLVSWAHLYGQFGPCIAPVESGESDFLAGHHVSYRRDLLLGYGARLEEMLEDECALFLDLRAEGRPMFIAGDVIVRHVNISRLTAYIYLDYLGQRSFASARARSGGFSRWKRVLYAGAAPLIPWIRLRRILHHLHRTDRYRELMPQILLPIACALAAGAWGEMLGYLIGPGDSAERKGPAELQRERFLSKKDPWSRQTETAG